MPETKLEMAVRLEEFAARLDADVTRRLHSLLRAGAAALRREADADKREHQWSNRASDKWESCDVCGIVRRADDQNKPCRGPASVSLREAEKTWTPREWRLRAALESIPVDLIHAIENGEAPAKIFLSVESCKLISAALAEVPPPDPRDEALRVAEGALMAIGRQYHSGTVEICQEALAAIRAAREEK